MARARTRTHGQPPGEAAQRSTPPGPTARPRPDVRTASHAHTGHAHAAEQMLALQQVAGNAAARKVASRASSGGAPRGPQRLWSDKEFKDNTFEGTFTTKSHAQVAVIKLLEAYRGLETPKNRPTAQHANLLAQMKASAELWIADHTVTLDGETSEDPNRQKRMQGFKNFIANVESELTLVKNSLGDDFSPEIGEEHKAYSKLRDYYKGSADSLFTKAAFVLDKAVSQPGDQASVEVEFEIPIDPSGVGFIGGRLSIEAEKDDASMIKTRTEMVVTGGANIGIAKVKAELGGYIEAQAATATDVMNLYSYGLYRRFRESKAIPREAANYMWGGQTSSHGYQKAEAWSRDLEVRLFQALPDVDPNDPKYKSLPPSRKKAAIDEDQAAVTASRERVKNTYVETGGIIAGKGEIGISELVEMEIGVTYTSGKKITAESIKAAKGEVGGKNKAPLVRGAQQALGEDTSAVSFSASVTVAGFELELEVEKSGADLEISFDGTGKIPATALEGVAAYLADIGIAAWKFAKTVKAAKDDEVLGPLAAFGGLQKALYGPVIQGAMTGKGGLVPGDVGLRLSMTAAREDGAWTGSIEISHVQSLSFEPPIGLKVELEKSSRLGALEYSGGAWALK